MLTLLFCFSLLFVQPYQWQAEPPDLVVRVHDAQGAAVADVIVQVRADDQELGSTPTNATGTAIFAHLAAPSVRVLVRGTAPNGVPLMLPGRDADGVALLLVEPPTVLDLRVESDGTLRPDPATMIMPQNSAPPFAISTNVPAATAYAATPRLQSAPTITPVAAASTPAGTTWVGWVVFIFLVLAISVVLWTSTRRRSNE